MSSDERKCPFEFFPHYRYLATGLGEPKANLYEIIYFDRKRRKDMLSHKQVVEYIVDGFPALDGQRLTYREAGLSAPMHLYSCTKEFFEGELYFLFCQQATVYMVRKRIKKGTFKATKFMVRNYGIKLVKGKKAKNQWFRWMKPWR